MRINVYYESTILSSEITSPITIKNLIENIKSYLNLKNTNFIILNSSSEILGEQTTIYPGQESVDYYLLPQMVLPSKVDDEKNEEKIEDLIMKVTGAKEKLEVKRSAIKSTRSDFFERFLAQDNINISRIMSALQNLEERNHINERTELNEAYVQELVEMGFPENNAREALSRAGNDLNRATEILISNGEENIGNDN